MSFRFVDYEASRSVPNVVVDGSPNEATVLTLTHWPGIGQPDGLAADLSAQMAFRFVRSGTSVDADAVTNNHFDQDGLVSMFALIDLERALPLEELLVDLAAAGDFAVYADRRAARASMVLAAYADPDTSPIGDLLDGPYEDQCAHLYRTCLELLPDLVLDPEPWRELWSDEDGHLAESERAFADGAISIDERPDVDLAVVRVDASVPVRRAHRFGSAEQVGVHPMAVNNRTGCFRVLESHDGHHTYTDRYESWVQYRSRRPLPRVDLRPLADSLAALDPAAGWTASAPSGLSPQLRTAAPSALDAAEVERRIIGHLRSAPAAWDPYPAPT